MKDSEHKNKKNGGVFFPNLDGWRFLAFFAVFYYHSFSTQVESILSNPTYGFLKRTTHGGNLGVDFFFVLSGFLIIYLLLNEKNKNGSISIKKFYIRRVLRIFPLYYFCVFFGFFLFPVFKSMLGAVPNENANLLYYLTFLGNIDLVAQSVLPDSSTLAVLWSVAIEEQFYLVIPITMALVATRYYVPIFVFVVIASLFFRFQIADNTLALSFHTFSYMGNLAIGGLAACFSFRSEKFISFFKNLSPFFIGIVYALVLVIFFERETIFYSSSLKAIDTTVIALLFAFIILEQNYGERSIFKMANNPLFTKLGKYTYGLYCLHTIAFVAVLQVSAKLGLNKTLWQILFIETPAALLLSVLLAFLSYHLYEHPFLKLKKRFSAV